MKNYKEIDKSELKIKAGDLIVYARQKETSLIEKIVNDCICSFAVFNWKGEQKKKEVEQFKYIDNNEAVNTDYIINKCKELMEENFFAEVLVDDTDNIVSTEKDFAKNLKKLAEELNKVIIVETKLRDSIKNKYPTLKDVINQELVKYADVVAFTEYNIIAKNKYGKTGIVIFEEGEDE